MTQFYAYIHCKPDGTPFYVGKGKNGRINNMKRGGWHRRVVDKYGAENIARWKFDCESEQAAFDLEIYLIAHYRCTGMKLCNLTDGGDGVSGYVYTTLKSAATREKISIAMMGNTHGAGEHNISAAGRERIRTNPLGKVATLETRLRIGDASRGRKHSPESRGLISIANRGKRMSESAKRGMSEAKKGNQYALGIKRSPETKEKMRAAALAYHARKAAGCV